MVANNRSTIGRQIQEGLTTVNEFLDNESTVQLLQAMTRLPQRVSAASERQGLLALAGVHSEQITALPLDSDPVRFAQALTALFKTYQVSRDSPDYHPMLAVL